MRCSHPTWDVLLSLWPWPCIQPCVSPVLCQLQVLGLTTLRCLVLRWWAPELESVTRSFPAPWRGALPCCVGEKEDVRQEWNRWVIELDLSGQHNLQPCSYSFCTGGVRLCLMVSTVWGWTKQAPWAQPAGGQPVSRGLSLPRDQPCRLPQPIPTACWICATRRNCHHEGLDKSWKEGCKKCVWKERSCICGVWSNCL